MPSEVLFPHLSATGPAPSYREVIALYRHVFSARVAEGVLRPLVLPYHLYGGFFLMLYLCIPHTKSPIVYAARWPVLAAIIWFEWDTLWRASSGSMATAMACGLTCAWGAVWSVTWLVFYRPQWDAKRVQRRRMKGFWRGRVWEPGDPVEWQEKYGKAPRRHEIEERHSKGEKFAWDVDLDNENLRKRAMGNGHSKPGGTNGHTNGSANPVAEIPKEDVIEEDDQMEYYWQAYPDKLSERISWVMDLVMNFRGPFWNWAISPLPPLPPAIRQRLGDPVTQSSSKSLSATGLRQYATRRELASFLLPTFIAGYFALDVLKTVMMKDPYYIFGPNTYSLPPHLANLTPVQLFIYRQSINTLAVLTSLQMAFSLMPLAMCLLLGPLLPSLRAEPAYFPSFWGSFSNIANTGLNGLWGSWWHQTFRFAFSAPSNYLITNGYLVPRSRRAKSTALVSAFAISALLHAAGSISQLAKTRPAHPPLFFMLQAVGIFLQTLIVSTCHAPLSKLPRIVRQAGNTVFTLVWLYATAWILVDDFSRGGIWMYEPIPISPLRGLGFGVEGDGWWCWEYTGIGWYTGKYWWQSGIALR